MRPAPMLLLLATITACQRGPAVLAPAVPQADSVSLERRQQIATAIHELVRRDFAHWEAVPTLDLDSLALAYHARVRASAGRRDFDLATREFLAALHNGHTGFTDDWLDHASPGPLGFRARHAGAGWVVIGSRVAGLAVGDTIVTVDGRDVESTFDSARRYLSASSERMQRELLFSAGFVFPPRFSLGLSNGRAVAVDRATIPPLTVPAPPVSGRWIEPDRVAYVRVPRFDGAEFEHQALELVRQYRAAPVLIVDVRGNGGGNTPRALTSALLTAPTSWWQEASTLRDNPFTLMPKEREEPSRGHLGQPKRLAKIRTVDADALFPGRLFVLTDRWCASSCEDFVMPLRWSGRAVVVGERTFGSTGQPRVMSFGDGMRVTVGAKRAYLPDGSPFEGVGLAPTHEIPFRTEDLVRRRDAILEAALELARR